MMIKQSLSLLSANTHIIQATSTGLSKMRNTSSRFLLFLSCLFAYFYISATVVNSFPSIYYDTSVCVRLNTTAAPFCASTVTWKIHSLTYVDQPASDRVAREYYDSMIVKQGEDVSEDCQRELRLISCGRSFTRCVNDRAPAVQLCKANCVFIKRYCSNINYEMVSTSCRIGSDLYRDCHSASNSKFYRNHLSLTIRLSFLLLPSLALVWILG